jgi:hypothetical protein
MAWPLSQDDNEAIQSPATSFGDTKLKLSKAKGNAIGVLLLRSTTFADVYRMTHPSGKKWAVLLIFGTALFTAVGSTPSARGDNDKLSEQQTRPFRQARSVRVEIKAKSRNSAKFSLPQLAGIPRYILEAAGLQVVSAGSGQADIVIDIDVEAEALGASYREFIGKAKGGYFYTGANWGCGWGSLGCC